MAQTILIESEQLYVTAISTNDLTVTRGVNGTTATAHADSTDISIYRYPDPVVQACLIQTSRLWKRKDQPFAPSAELPPKDSFSAFTRLDPDVRQLLSSYRKLPVGVGT